MSRASQLEEFIEVIRAELHIDEDINAETPLISAGIIDSFDVVALLAVIESRFGAEIYPESIDIETFDTPSQIFARIESVRT